MKKFGSKKIWIAVVAVVVVGIIAVQAVGNAPAEEVTEQVLAKKVSVQTITPQDQVVRKLTASGTVVPRQFSVIRSLTPGTIQFMVPVGQEVVVGQSLFNISDANIENNYFNQVQSYRQTEILSDQRVLQAELALNSAEARLRLANRSLENAQAQTEQNTRNTLSSAVVTYRSAMNAIQQTMSFLSGGGIPELNRYRYAGIRTTDFQLALDAPQLYNTAVVTIKDFPISASASNVRELLVDLQDAILSIKSIVDMSVLVVDTAIPTDSTQAASLNADKAVLTSYKTQIDQYTNGVINTLNALESTSLTNQVSLDQAQNSLELAQTDYENAQISLASARDSAEKELSITQNQLDTAAYNFANLSLNSPFTGTVLKRLVDIGEQISAGQPLLELGNLDVVEITVSIDADFAQSLTVGQTVVIESEYQGIITEIEPAGDIQSGKVGVTVQADNNEVGLVAGEIADVTFNLVYEEENLIIVPLKSVTIEGTGSTVLVVSEGIAQKQSVELGAVFGSFVSVTYGLEPGDQVILIDGTFVTEGDEVEIVSETFTQASGESAAAVN